MRNDNFNNLKAVEEVSMEAEKKSYVVTTKLFEKVGGFEDVIGRAIDAVLHEPIPSCTTGCLGLDLAESVRNFGYHYRDKYTTLKKKVGHQLMDVGSSTIDMTESKIDRNGILKHLTAVKRKVMISPFHILDFDVIEASHSAYEMAKLMYRKRVSDDEFHQVISGLVRWQLLDELQTQVQQPIDFSRCFAPFAESTKTRGRREEDLYENVNKEHLRDTLEALHQEKYSMTVEQHWNIAKEETSQFLRAFMLSIYREPLKMLYGKMAAFHRFFKDVCGYSFAPVKDTLSKWYSAYCDFVNERNRHTMHEPKGARQRRFIAIEALAEWMRSRLPQYQVCPV